MAIIQWIDKPPLGQGFLLNNHRTELPFLEFIETLHSLSLSQYRKCMRPNTFQFWHWWCGMKDIADMPPFHSVLGRPQFKVQAGPADRYQTSLRLKSLAQVGILPSRGRIVFQRRHQYGNVSVTCIPTIELVIGASITVANNWNIADKADDIIMGIKIIKKSELPHS